ncbi:MAG: DUF1302 domain-containing protein [Epsilonproteobacteria bacterium]|nr:DUF1302 domain-containing protein [Campylobacterota bacterium]
MRLLLASLLTFVLLQAENLDDVLEGFDDGTEELMEGFEEENSSSHTSSKPQNSGLTGSIAQEVAISPFNEQPHHALSSLKSSLFLDYEHKFDNGFKFKTNAKAYYDAIYRLRGVENYTKEERDELQNEVELFDAYVEGSINSNLDMKIGRQVVVWGRSDTIRVTDVLNPIDNRRPGMVDIEDLRLPVAMAKFDYFVDNWRITPIAVLEQRLSKNPPFGSAFNPSPIKVNDPEAQSKVTPALSIGGEFSGWDINFYTAQLNQTKESDVNMFGTALNILQGSWLLKSELAYFDAALKETNGLLGVEYNGIADTLISYDIALKKVDTQKESYQHAFRVSSDFINATLKANYLISLFGSKLDEGGFQRAWVTYDIADGINTNVGLVDYIGGSSRFDSVENNDLLFMNAEYNF